MIRSSESGTCSVAEHRRCFVDLAGRLIGRTSGATNQAVGPQREGRLGSADGDARVPFQRGRPRAQSMVGLGQPMKGGRADAVPRQVGPIEMGGDQLADGGGARGGSLERTGGQILDRRPVDLVADAHEDGHPAPGDGARDDLFVEGGEVGAGATASHHGDQLDTGSFCGSDRTGHLVFGAGTLDRGVHQEHAPVLAARLELGDEVVEGRGSARW